MKKLVQHLSRVWLSAATVLAGAAVRLWAEEPGAATQAAVPVPTLGGKQFWADELFFHQWRIQRNAIDGHCRLLDEHDFRHASGSFEQCRVRLEQIRQQRQLPPMQGKAVIVLHGLGRSRSSMDKLCTYLREKGGYAVFNVSYPSTQRDISEHARALARIIENLDGIEEINFVGHSLGNIVIRCYLGGPAHNPADRRSGPRRGRFVMLGPPNHGSLAALKLADNGLFRAAAGDAGQQLGRDWDRLAARLATPTLEFGIIAGGTGSAHGLNPLLPGDNDGVISVATTRLAGAADFVVVPVLHTLLMDDDRALQYTLQFLQKGFFRSAEQRQPLATD